MFDQREDEMAEHGHRLCSRLSKNGDRERNCWLTESALVGCK